MPVRHRKKTNKKFIDSSPEQRASLDTIGTGPARKNLAKPNDPAAVLIQKEYRAKASALSQSIS